MTRILYDLAAGDPDVRFSPFCWRAKLALAHVGLPYETVPWRFTDKEAIAASGQGLVPVLVDDDRVLHDSQTIAEYLDDRVPGAALFGGAGARALTGFVRQWTETTLHPPIARLVLADIFKKLDPSDQPYFRRTREARFGRTIEEMAAAREEALPALDAALKPLRETLRTQPFLAGDAPAYADYIVIGALQWATIMSSTVLLTRDDPVSLWRATVLARLLSSVERDEPQLAR